MRAALYAIIPILALLASAGVWATVLPACAAAPWLGRFTPADCPPPLTPAALAAAAENARGEALRAELRRLERDLATRAACERAPVLRAGDPLDADRWAARDVSLMEGCWAFDGDLARVDPATGVVSRAETWRVCFDAAGAGTQEIGFADGAACEGPISAAFDGGGRLTLADGAPPACEPGPALTVRRGGCVLDGYSRAACALGDGAASVAVTLRRAE